MNSLERDSGVLTLRPVTTALAGGFVSGVLFFFVAGHQLADLVGETVSVILLPALIPVLLSPFLVIAFRDRDALSKLFLVLQFVAVWYIAHWLPALLVVVAIYVFGVKAG